MGSFDIYIPDVPGEATPFVVKRHDPIVEGEFSRVVSLLSIFRRMKASSACTKQYVPTSHLYAYYYTVKAIAESQRTRATSAGITSVGDFSSVSAQAGHQNAHAGKLHEPRCL